MYEFLSRQKARTQPPELAEEAMTYYLSVDIETTGLDPETCQTLEIAAVLDSITQPLEDLPVFHCYVDNGLVLGEPYALSMHPHILRAIATAKAPCPIYRSFDVMLAFKAFLDKHLGTKDCVTIAGKNFGSFDRQFLAKLPDSGAVLKRFRHRYIDTGNLWWTPKNDRFTLPDSAQCLQRAGIDHDVAHTALEDALDTCRLIRRHPSTSILWEDTTSESKTARR